MKRADFNKEKTTLFRKLLKLAVAGQAESVGPRSMSMCSLTSRLFWLDVGSDSKEIVRILYRQFCAL